MKECTVCHAESADDARFCGSCGTMFAEVSGEAICPNCLKPAPENAKFCPDCGYSFTSQSPLSIQPLGDRQIIEIEPPFVGAWTRFRAFVRWIAGYARIHPYRLSVILTIALLIPLCCAINSFFALRGTIHMLEAPKAGLISTLTPLAISIKSSTEIVSVTPSLTHTIQVFTSTLNPTNTGTPMPPRLQTGFGGCPPPAAIAEIGKVEYVIDGDTIEVVLDDELVRVRYIGIDAPETVGGGESPQPYGVEAFQENKKMVEGKEVLLVPDVSEMDNHNRLLRYVFLGDTFINYELVRRGYAGILPSPPDVACDGYFRQAQQTAAREAFGIWATPLAATTAIQPAVKFVESTQALAPPTQAVSVAAVPGAAIPGAACDCSGPDLDCKDFPPGSAAQACFEQCNPQYGDIFRLDRDKDGLACESN